MQTPDHHLPHADGRPTPTGHTHEAENEPSPRTIALHRRVPSQMRNAKPNPTNLASRQPDRIVINPFLPDPGCGAEAPPKIPPCLNPVHPAASLAINLSPLLALCLPLLLLVLLPVQSVHLPGRARAHASLGFWLGVTYESAAGHGEGGSPAIPCRRWAEDVIVLSSGRPSWQPSAEGADPPPPEKLYYKTKLCDKYEASGRCTYEDGCTFAHGRAELRPPVPPPSSAAPHGFGGGVWRRPPGAEQDQRYGGGGGGKVRHNFRDKGSCHFGDKCAFPHASPAPAPGAPIRGTGEQKQAAEAQRSATPPAARPTTAPRYVGAPAPGRAFPPRPRATARGASWSSWPFRKTNGIYGDWPEQYQS